ncbi:lipid IV(A) 3-deoxy-D-manno-octulosonic acid transferase [Methylophilus aquaticus]|uniref:3-deoxy-D-manno-octulosonic acid transferase n=1 Tax=Methylophilus aquaticus TaxID=1971610 RepID=A0ABT9JTE1_9PROT|nr:lipid IV(A) 3-deoxy-D-manno-octulosonic acid transferase [Methylophilus aquaticus]MDP8567818.1 lipid IV(A) 3-deoxy-D-manno-octulosonic acid transferase [Methylophilus aquaticus]
MPRLLYTLLMFLVALLLPLKLLWRSLKQPDYRQHWAERYGFYKSISSAPVIWIHCVSVGETRATQPLIQALLTAYPQHTLLITHGTPTGRDTSSQLFAGEIAEQRLVQAYLPVDTPGAAKRFLEHFKPAIGLLMETELWFHLIDQASKRQIPMALLSARLSEKSARGYAKLGQLTRTGLQQLALVAAQTEADAQRLQALGAERIVVCGNLKFDVTPPADSAEKGQQLRQLLGTQRPVCMAASTREGEEPMILDAMQGTEVLTLLVPRHPQRFAEVEALLKARGVRYVLRTELAQPLHADMQVVLGNSMGEMYTYYAASDFAVMGGSLQPLGGQNLIEAAAMGVPTILGPHMFNFAQVTQAAVAADAAVQLSDVTELSGMIAALAADKAKVHKMSQAAKGFTLQHRGATQRLMAVIGPLLKK